MLIYPIFYLLIVLVGLWNTKKYKQYKNIILVFIVFIFSSCRFDVGFDYGSYYKITTETANSALSLYYDSFGFLVKWIVEFSRYFNFPQLFFIITSLIILFSFHTITKLYSKNYFLSILIFISIPYFLFNSFSIIRQYCAIMIIFAGTKYIIQKKFIFYLLIVILATIFHTSAIIGVLLYFINKIKFNKTVSILFISSSFFIQPIITNFIQTYFPYYSLYLEKNAGTGVAMQILLLGLSIIFIFFNHIFKNKESIFFYNSFLVGVFLYNTFIFIGDAATRVSLYFIIFLVLLIPELEYKFRKKQFFFIVILFALLMYTSIFYLASKNPIKNPYIPYQTFIEKSNIDLRYE